MSLTPVASGGNLCRKCKRLSAGWGGRKTETGTGAASLLRPSRPGTAAWGCPGAGSPRPSRRRLGRGVPAGHGGAGWAAGPPLSGALGVPRDLFYFSWISCENKAKSRSPRGGRAERGGGSRERRLEAADLDREAPEVTAPGAGGAAPLRWRRVGGVGPVLSPRLSSVRWVVAVFPLRVLRIAPRRPKNKCLSRYFQTWAAA